MRAQIGKYYFGRHRSNWGIWQYEFVSERGTMGRFIKDVFSYEDAVKPKSVHCIFQYPLYFCIC